MSWRFGVTVLAILGSLVAAAPESHAARRPGGAPALDFASVDDALREARAASVARDLTRFERAAARVDADHPLAAYVEYWRLRAMLAGRAGAPPPGEVDARIGRFLEANDGTLVAELMRRDWLGSLGKRGRWGEFDTEFARWSARDHSGVLCLAGASRVLRGEPPGADALAAYWQVREFSEGCRVLADMLVNAGVAPRAETLRRLRRALEDRAPGTVRYLAEHLGLKAQGVSAALRDPQRALQHDGAAPLRLIALATLARSSPSDAARAMALHGGRLATDDRSFVWALIAAAGARELDPESATWARRALDADVSDRTRAWLARAALLAGDWRLLLDVVAAMGDEGSADPAWTYWRARALREIGHPAAAEKALREIAGQFHFYGQLAAEDLGELSLAPPPPAPPTPAELAAVERNPAFARAQAFYRAGLRYDGNLEWNFGLRGLDDRALLAAATRACERGQHDRCVNTANRTRLIHDFSLRFVTPYREELSPVAADQQVDLAWIYGLIRQESRFITDARSHVGATGLMQIMPRTGRWIARKLGVADFNPRQLHEVPTNLRFGTFYMKAVLDDLEGSPVLASAAYNAGPGRSRRWRASLPAAVDGALFAEIIPFDETRRYVQNVLSNATYYSALFTGRPASLRAWLGRITPAVNEPTELP